MNAREQVIVVLFGLSFSGIGLLWLTDVVLEHVDAYLARERVWRGIEIRSCRERHPSNQVSVFDQDAR